MSERRGQGNPTEGKGDGRESVVEFLQRALPPQKASEVTNIVDGIGETRARYDRYAEQTEPYRVRTARLRKIEEGSSNVFGALLGLDVMSRDDIASRIGPRTIEEYVGLLLTLTLEAKRLGKEIQERGRPRDVARERWIREMADIFENAFGE